MKNVVMIAYGFPPEGNAGAYRPLRFVRQLPNLGWRPIVISAIPHQYERYDSALLDKVPRDVEVIRVKCSDSWQAFQSSRSRMEKSLRGHHRARSNLHNNARYNLRARMREIVRTAEAWWYHPDMAMPWIRPAVEATIEVCQRKRIDVIWATAGPVSSFVVAQRSAFQMGVPYVLDFRDSWTITYNAFEARQPEWAKRRARRSMHKLIGNAKAVVFRYHDEAECFWQAYSGALDASRVHIIPNGYESPIEEVSFPRGDKCTVLYAGTLPDYRYDTFLKALSMLKQTDPCRAKQLRILFVGEGMDVLADDAGALYLEDIVETSGWKPHSEITCLQGQAHALLVLGRPSTMNGYELFAGAKLFGYLKTARPIIGVLPKDQTKNILSRVGVRTIADVESVSEIIKVLRLLLDSWAAGTLSSLIPDPKACEAYSSERQTVALVRALEGLPAEQTFFPGMVDIPPSLRAVIRQMASSSI
jgi:glycosyltransferase involved in cell wall biosynthesis